MEVLEIVNFAFQFMIIGAVAESIVIFVGFAVRVSFHILLKGGS